MSVVEALRAPGPVTIFVHSMGEYARTPEGWTCRQCGYNLSANITPFADCPGCLHALQNPPRWEDWWA